MSMARDFKVFKRAFNAGEISQSAKWRNDFEKHAYACEALENFYVSPLGGISRREGTRFLANLGSVSRADNVRLVPFEYNRELSLILALHTEDAYEKIDDFVFPKVFSLLLKIPENYTETGELLKKDELALFRESNGTYTLSVNDKKATFKLNEDSHKIAIIYDSSFSVYLDGEKTENSPIALGLLGNKISPMVTASSQGLSLKLYTYDITKVNPAYGDYYYTLAHFLNDTYPSMVLSPEWENQYSTYGSKVAFNSATAVLTNDKTVYEVAESNFLEANPEWNGQDAISIFEELEPQENRLSAQIEDWLELKNNEEYIRLSSEINELERLINAEYAKENPNYEQIELWQNEKEEKEEIYSIWLQDINCVENLIFSNFTSALGYESFDAFLIENNFTLISDGEEQEPNVDAFKEALENGLDYSTLRFAKIANFVDEIRIPFYVPRGISVCFNGELLTKNVKFSLRFENGSSIEIVNGQSISIDSDVSSIDIALASHRGIFIWNLFSVSLQNSFAGGKKTVLFDVYDIEGNIKQKNFYSPILRNALHEFQYKQVGGDIYFAHSSFLPQKLSIDGGGNFTWSEAVTIQPSLNSPEKDISLSFKGAEILYVGDTVQVTSNAPFFSSDMVGGQVKVDYVDKSQKNYRFKFDSTGKVSDIYPSYGNVTLRTEGGVWDGTLLLEESTDDGKTWSEIARVYSVQGSNNQEIKRETFDIRSVVRARMLEQNKVEDTESTVVDPNTEGCFFTISTNTTNMVWIEVLNVHSSQMATVRILNPCRGDLTSKAVYKSSWGENFGYPRAVDIHEERLVLAGNRNQPSTVWLSATNNWDNFRAISSLETDPLSYTLASDDGEPISWIISRSDLMIGMGSSEWSLGSRDAGQALSASIVQASNQSDDGVEYIMPTKAGGMVIFVRRGGMEIASLTYDFANDGYNATSLTTMYPDLLSSGVVAIFNQLSPTNKIYVVCNDGTLAVFTYDKENNVAAWGRFLFGDGVISAMALSSGRYRSIFLVVKRDGYLCLERLDPNEMGTNNWLDCVPISEDVEVPNGLQTNIPYASRMKTMPFFIEDSIKVYGIQFFMRSSMGGKFRVVGFNSDSEEVADQWQDFKFKEDEIFNPNKQPRDFRYKAVVSCMPLEEGAVEVVSDYPAPFNLNAIAGKVEKL